MVMKIVAFLIALLCTSALALSSTIYVPDDYPTIQGAINATTHGDTIVVRPGTYVENIDFHGRAVHLKSEHGTAVTTIDGNRVRQVVMFQSGEGPDSIIDGFTIANGYAWRGGGIRCQRDSSPMIINNIITYNRSVTDGGGIYCSASPMIVNNIICNNIASGKFCFGGGIYCVGSTATIINNTVAKNSADYGSAIGIGSYSDVSITNTILQGKKRWSLALYYSTTAVISYSDLRRAQSNIMVFSGSTLTLGPGMIDANPSFVDYGGDDYHLTLDSPCRNAGDDSVVTVATDFEGDPRIRLGSVDIGADEFSHHLYAKGKAVPGDWMSLRVVGPPGAWVALGEGPGIQDPPEPSSYGPIHIARPWTTYNLGLIPSDGVLRVPVTVPGNWIPGNVHYFQALVSNSITLATNLMVVEVE